MEKNFTVFGVTFANVPKHHAEKLRQMESYQRVENPFYTVKEYIEKYPESVVGRRISKKGVALVTVQYPDCTRQYEEERLWNTCSYQYKEGYGHD